MGISVFWHAASTNTLIQLFLSYKHAYYSFVVSYVAIFGSFGVISRLNLKKKTVTKSEKSD